MKVSGSGGRGESGVVGEEAGIALVSIHSDYPRYTEERTGLVCKVRIIIVTVIKNYLDSSGLLRLLPRS